MALYFWKVVPSPTLRSNRLSSQTTSVDGSDNFTSIEQGDDPPIWTSGQLLKRNLFQSLQYNRSHISQRRCAIDKEWHFEQGTILRSVHLPFNHSESSQQIPFMAKTLPPDPPRYYEQFWTAGDEAKSPVHLRSVTCSSKMTNGVSNTPQVKEMHKF